MTDDPILASMRALEDIDDLRPAYQERSADEALRAAGELPPLPPEYRPFHDALDKLGTSGEGLELDALKDSAGHVGVTVEATKDIGKGWTVAGGFQYAKDMGYALMGKVRWTPKK